MAKYEPLSFFQIINPDNSMTFNRFIAHAIGATETVIYFALISKMTYYQKKGMLDDDGFFYATALDIQESTTYTKRIQMSSLKRLEEIGLIDTKYDGLPRRKYYKINNDQDLIVSLVEQGEKIASALRNKKANKSDCNQQLQNVTASCYSEETEENAEKPHNSQQLQNVTARSDEMLQQEVTNCHDKQQQIVTACSNNLSPLTYKTKQEETKYNQSKSNQSSDDGLDEIDLQTERLDYLTLVKQQVDYEFLLQTQSAERVNEMIEVMVDVICSRKPNIRVNGEDMPHEVVKSRFLKLNGENLSYVLYAMDNNAAEIKNVRSYLITALYNSAATHATFWETMANHDMRTTKGGV